jgi:hypothetical protein
MSAPVWTRGLENRLPWSVEVELSLVGGRVDGLTRILESTVRVPSGEEGATCDFIRLTVLEAPAWVTPATAMHVAVLPPGGEAFLLGYPLESFNADDGVGVHLPQFSPRGNVVGVVMHGASAPEASAGRVRVKLSGSRVH